MKLYYRPGACSMCPHIVLRETGLAFELERVDRETRRTDRGADFLEENPLGYVPLLVLNDGRRLRETSVIIQYLADLKPELNLAPPAGSPARYRMLEWLNFIATELHKGTAQIFNARSPKEWKIVAREILSSRYGFVATSLEGREFLLDEGFGIADCYLFTTLCWTKNAGLSIDAWPSIRSYYDGLARRPKIAETLAAEGKSPL